MFFFNEIPEILTEKKHVSVFRDDVYEIYMNYRIISSWKSTDLISDADKILASRI